jgi:hypothetical protein
MVVRMLNRIIYCGQKKLNKFILCNFPESLDDVKEFESSCAKISAIIYPTGSTSTVEISHAEMNKYNIESLFQKHFKLKTMNEWSFELFDEKLGNKVEFGLVSGRSMSGKSESCKILEKSHGFHVLDMNRIEEKCKNALGTEEEPFEGEVPLEEIEKSIRNTI